MIINILNFFQESLNDNMGFVTFSVGLFAIYLYIKQKIDRKRDSASLILQEIRFAEKKIRDYSTYKQYQLSDKLLPTNNWNNNIHLFLNDLEENDIDLISRFYSNAEYVDTLIDKISDFKNKPADFFPISVVPSSQAIAQNSGQSFEGQSPAQMVVVGDPMAETQKILSMISKNIENVYNTPVGNKLKKISKKEW